MKEGNMKRFKELVTVVIACLLAILPSMTATAQSQNEVQTICTSYDGEEDDEHKMGHVEPENPVMEVPDLDEDGDTIPPGCGQGCVSIPELAPPIIYIDEPIEDAAESMRDGTSDDASNSYAEQIPLPPGAIEGYRDSMNNYLAIIDIATGRYYEDEIMLQPHKIYAVHTYLSNTYVDTDEEWMLLQYLYPELVTAGTVYGLGMDLYSDRQTSHDAIALSADETLQIQPIFGSASINRQKVADLPRTKVGFAMGSDNTMAIIHLQSQEVIELVFFFQTVADGDEPIELGSPDLLESAPILGDLNTIIGTPLLCPTEFAVNADAQIGETIAGLPAIADRKTWWVENPEQYQK